MTTQSTTTLQQPVQSTTPAPALALRSVRKVLGGRAVVDGLDLDVAHGELVCIVGPSGCGKTTTLRMVAGFLEPDAGSILIDGRDVTDLGPQHRPTAMVFQNYALWPHMTVLRNVAFGLRARGMTRAAAGERAHEALTLVGLERNAERLPGNLSGGEQQRVALARALVLEPTLLLMDEPLSNLDAQLRLRVREELVELHHRTGVTMLLVTHDQDEALSIADRVAVMSDGQFDQIDPPSVVYRDPATSFVAGFVGRVNVLAGAVESGKLRFTAAAGGPFEVSCGDGPVEVAVRPEEVRIVASSARSAVEGEIVRRISRGHFDEILVDTPLGTLRSYVTSADLDHSGRVGVTFGRMLLYQSGRLVGTDVPAQSVGQ